MKVSTRFVSAAAAVAVAVLFLTGTAVAAESYKIDPIHSQVIFKVGHFGVSKIYGRFNDLSGSFVFDAEKVAGSSFEATIKADSIDTHDAKRDQHLKSPDFLNAKQFPVITLKSKSVSKSADGVYEAVCDLNLHGVKKEVTIRIEFIGEGDDPWGNHRSGFGARFTIQRAEFGMNFMPGGIGNDVEMIFNIEGIRE